MLHYVGKACTQLALVQATYKLMHSWLLFIAKISYKCILLLMEQPDRNVDELVKTHSHTRPPLQASKRWCLQIKTIFKVNKYRHTLISTVKGDAKPISLSMLIVAQPL
jgi:hypothetical protein